MIFTTPQHLLSEGIAILGTASATESVADEVSAYE